ncbi:RNA-binding protein [Dehalobacter sp. DCM]|uniref:RNA recognition motif domain-containing protein n=1 Tax=Dehalobacter sp. DCM TaxID=2907827 RepID=UPI003081DA0C|nr:RNA-binding protein [Dehalobacter sp. DCM]
MTKTLYVGNLPWSTSSEDLTDFFSQYGNVIGSRIITDRETGRSRGFGFVEVAADDAERLAEELNGSEFNGRSLTVNEARPRQTV